MLSSGWSAIGCAVQTIAARRYRGLLAASIGLLVAFTPAIRAMAQNAPTVRAVQSASFVYGESITFRVEGQSTTPIIQAQLTIQILNRQAVSVQPVSLPPQVSFATSATVPISALKMPPFAQVTYFWTLQDASGAATQTESSTVAYEDNSVPWVWKISSQNGMSIHWGGTDSAPAETALAAAQDALTNLTTLTGARSSQALHIYVYPELSMLASSLRRHQQRVQDWVAAYAIPDQSIVLVAVGAGPDATANLKRDVAHEIAHVLVYQVAGQNISKVPGWLNEGLALTSASEPDTALGDVMDRAIHDGVLLSMQTLCASNFGSLSPHDASLAYAQSESFVRYLAARFGPSQIRGLITIYAEGADCAGGVQTVLGVSLADLESQWHAGLSQSAAQTTVREGSLTPWIIAWAVSIALALLYLSPQPAQSEERNMNETKRAFPPIANGG